jgi:hypothetical protein
MFAHHVSWPGAWRFNVEDIDPPEHAAPRQRQPFMIMNPRSGGGKVSKFGLKDMAVALGAEVSLLEGPRVVDVAAPARHAVDRGPTCPAWPAVTGPRL